MHLLLRSKHIAPNPHIARAPELVIQNTTINSSLYQEVVDVSSFISSTVRSTDSRTVPDLFVCKSRRLIVILLIFLSVSLVCLFVSSSFCTGRRTHCCVPWCKVVDEKPASVTSV
jgi:hypothetical protein